MTVNQSNIRIAFALILLHIVATLILRVNDLTHFITIQGLYQMLSYTAGLSNIAVIFYLLVIVNQFEGKWPPMFTIYFAITTILFILFNVLSPSIEMQYVYAGTGLLNMAVTTYLAIGSQKFETSGFARLFSVFFFSRLLVQFVSTFIPVSMMLPETSIKTYYQLINFAYLVPAVIVVLILLKVMKLLQQPETNQNVISIKPFNNL